MLLTPWAAMPRSSRRVLMLVLALLVIGDVSSRIFGVATHAWAVSAIMLGIANAMCWLLLLPNGLRLAIAAHRMRLPGISRDTGWSALWYAVLGIGVPLLCQFPQGYVLGFVAVQMLVASAVMMYMVLPAGLGVVTCLLAALFNGVLQVFSSPGLSDPRLLTWTGTVAVVLVVLFARQCGQLLRGDHVEHGIRRRSLVDLQRIMRGSQRDPATDAGLVQIRPDRMLAHSDGRKIGPQAPSSFLRMALGGVYLPQTIIGRLNQGIWIVLMVAFTSAALRIVTPGHYWLSHVLHDVFSRENFMMAIWVFAVYGLALVMISVERLTLRWRRVNAELPLLALLPGLDQTWSGKRLLLRTAIHRPAGQLGLLLLAGWVGSASLGLGWTVALAMLVVALGCLGYLCAMALSLFGGRPPSRVGKCLLVSGLFGLVGLTVLLPQMGQGWDVLHTATVRDGLVALWTALMLFLSWLGFRGWRELQKRPHPYLSP